MKKFLRRVLFFLLPIALLAYPLDRFLSAMLIQAHDESGEFEVSKDIYSGKAECDIAVYGSSRAWVHFNSQMMQDSLHHTVYNFGIDGHNFWLQYLRHLEYLKHNKKPLSIILSVDAFTLQKRPDLYYSSQFLPNMLWNRNVYNYTHSYKGFDTYDYCVPMIRYAGKTKSFREIWGVIKGDSAQPLRHKGFAGMDLAWNKDFEAAQANGKKYTIHFDRPSVLLFERFLKECKKANINVILVYTPEYIEGQNFITNRDQLMHYYRKTAGENKIPLIDFSQDPICSNKAFFYNSNHLNKTGADLFTQKLIARLKPLLASPAPETR